LKIVVAMSGGIDSSVAAALLKAPGHDVTGVTICLRQAQGLDERQALPDAVTKSREAAEIIGIPHHTIDLSDIFQEEMNGWQQDTTPGSLWMKKAVSISSRKAPIPPKTNRTFSAG
jgi:tRNA U34 2-thiouridine synthase MnmA/TrmU